MQFRAPLTEQKVGTNDIGTIEKINSRELTIKLDGEKLRQVTFELEKFRHLDCGYAVTSISSQRLGAYWGILNVNAHESALLLNKRTAYVARSRAIYDVQIYVNSKDDMPHTLDGEAIRRSRSMQFGQWRRKAKHWNRRKAGMWSEVMVNVIRCNTPPRIWNKYRRFFGDFN